MTHNTIQEQLLSYLDGEIPEESAAEIRRHLRQCEECRALAGLWEQEKEHTKRQSAPPYLWTRIQAELQQPAPIGWLDRIAASLRPMLQPAIVVATFILVIFAGIQIGEEIVTGVPQQSAQIRQEFRMDYFAAVPSGSIGEALVAPGNDERKVTP